MRKTVLACKTLQDEIEYLFQKHQLSYPVIWIESGLHSIPKKLHKVLQEKIDAGVDCDCLLLALGRCGNSVNGLVNGDFELIFPKVEDCISLFFGSEEARAAYAREHASFYMTAGWLRGEQNPLTEYRHMLEKYGEETAKSIMDMMYGHYQELALLDTGVAPIEPLLDETEPIEEILNMKRAVIPGKLSYLEQLLTGPWDEERFYHIPPKSTIAI